MAFYVGLSAGIFLQDVTFSCSTSSHPTLYWTTSPNHVCVNVFSGCASWWNRAWTQRTVRLPSAASWRTCMTSTPPAVTSRTSSARFSGRIQFSTIWGYFFCYLEVCSGACFSFCKCEWYWKCAIRWFIFIVHPNKIMIFASSLIPVPSIL